jgi:hypothetical protein
MEARKKGGDYKKRGVNKGKEVNKEGRKGGGRS